MLQRPDTEGVILITQPAHAWLSGQMAQAWRDDEFSGVREEIRLAATQHDIGFVPWEQTPELNPATGLPYSFLEMPRRIHLDIWSRGIQDMLGFGRYPALLVSRHFTMLAQRTGRETSPHDQQLTGAFLAVQSTLQTTLETSLVNDAFYGPFSTPEMLNRHQQLVSLWDWLSLLLCHGLKKAERVHNVPFRDGSRELILKPADAEGFEIRFEPWPFARQTVRLTCEGRRLLGVYDNPEGMRKVLEQAAPVVLSFTLRPAEL